jgi:crotonobetainyl-CoA:carnitine CoA-transferase CaiB-like acyl-CoA transferase
MMPFREDYYWPRFCEALGKPEWAEAEEYSTPSLRGKNRKALGAGIQEIFHTNTMENWLQILEDAGCIAVRIE